VVVVVVMIDSVIVVSALESLMGSDAISCTNSSSTGGAAAFVSDAISFATCRSAVATTRGVFSGVVVGVVIVDGV